MMRGIRILVLALSLLLVFRSSQGFKPPCKPLLTTTYSNHQIVSVTNSISSKYNANIGLTHGPLLASIESEPKEAPKSTLPPWLPSFGTAALGGALFGLDIGSSSSVLRILGQSGFTTAGGTEMLDSFQLGQVASGSLFGAIVSSLLIIVLGDKKIGRKIEIQVASLLFIAGTAVQVSCPSYNILLLGRWLYGLGIGVAMHAAPLYIAETSPNALRGTLISLKEAAIVFGIVAGYAAGAYFGSTADWRDVWLYTGVPLELLMAFGAFALIGESPRWLALRGRDTEAVEVMQALEPELTVTKANARVAEMKAVMAKLQVKTENAIGAGVGVGVEGGKEKPKIEFVEKLQEIFGSKYNKRALTIGVGLILFQQLSGQPSVLYFANRIFENAGFGYEAALGIGVFKLLMTFISSNLVENPNFGRRTLLLVGNTGVTISLLLLSYFYTGIVDGDISSTPGAQFNIIASMLLFVGSYQIGFGPIAWLILSEVFPLQIRSAAVSLGTLVNFSSNLLVTLIFEAERSTLGESALFLQFGLIGAAALAFTYFYVFETRGLSLEEIELKLKDAVDGDSIEK